MECRPRRRPGVVVLSEAPDWLAAYDYVLPDEQIARFPAEPRDDSRLLVLDRTSSARTQAAFRDLPRFLETGDLVVLNETRVVPARVFTRLERTGRAVEVLLSHPETAESAEDPGLASEGETWAALLGPARRLRRGDRLVVLSPASGTHVSDATHDSAGTLASGATLVLLDPLEGGMWRLRAEGASMHAVMESSGHIPLPPYLGREDRPEDRSWYQTVFARSAGAVAAPTAGLHFTEALLRGLGERGIELARVTLHVGPGTFLPVRADAPANHRVWPERYSIPVATAEALDRTKARGRRVVAVGTTTVRALETAARRGSFDPTTPRGVDSTTPKGVDPTTPRGVDPTTPKGVDPATPREGWTDLTILPGHSFAAVDGLVTNFHLPRSSLLLLVSAFAGRERVLEAYADARNSGFRFYSYGDAMLIL